MPRATTPYLCCLSRAVQPPRPVLHAVMTQGGYHAERRLRTFVDDEYRQLVCPRKRRGLATALRPLSFASY